MKKIVVIYESKYGFTKRYAQWIAEELHCPLFERKTLDPQQLHTYDVIIYGGGLYAGGMSGLKQFSKNQIIFSDKQLILFTCGLADPNNPENIATIRRSLAKILQPEMRSRTQIFHLRGGIDYARLTLVHRSMMSMLRKALMKKDANSLREEDRQLLDTYGKHVDFTDRASIQPLIQYVMS